MTYNKAILPAAEGGEESFSASEIFFSRTDKRGVIKAGNAVFRRVSGFDWDRLIGAPHRVVRHPDMPRAVFWLMWQMIQAGKPIAAFVKNQSASGRWYWVLAVVIPCADSYVSVRIKPGGALFQMARSLYAEVLAGEAGLTPEQSAGVLLQRLAEQGFPTYTDFAARILEQELAARDLVAGHGERIEARILAGLGESLAATGLKQTDLLQEFEALQSIPTNMRIIASRLEPSGGPVSAISDNYKFASGEISRRLEAFAGAESNLCLTMSAILRDGLFLSSIAKLLGEVQRFLATEDNSAAPLDFAAERALFAEVAGRCRSEAQETMMKAEQTCGLLNLSSSEIRRMMLGLDTIRVMGRVESGRLGPAGLGLSSAIDQLDLRHASIATLLQELMDLSSAIRNGINAYQRLLPD